MGNGTISKLYSSHSYFSFPTKLLWLFTVTQASQKVTYCNFKISNLLNFFVNMLTCGREISKLSPPTVVILYTNQTFPECSLWQFLPKLLIRISKNSNAIIFKWLTFNIVANGKISKRYSSHSYYSFPTNFLWMFPVTGLTKVTYSNFEISNYKKHWKFSSTWDCLRGKISKTLIHFQPTFFWILRVTVLCEE